MITNFTFIAEWLKSFTKSERGASLVEYALLVALIAVACIVAVQFLSGEAKETFSNVGTELNDAQG